MRDYLIRLEVYKSGPDDLGEAKQEFTEEFSQTILDDSIEVVDVQQLPKRMDQTHTATELAEVVEEGGQSQVYPEDAPPHPWDQGLWIFPEGHPLAEYERHAKARGEKFKDQFREMGEQFKALPPAPRMLDNDS